MRKAIIIIIIAMLTVVTSFTTVSNFSFAEEKDYYYFETDKSIHGFGIDQCNKYYVHDFTTPVSFVIENGDIPNDDIKDMINNNAVFEQRLISSSGLFTYDVKLYLDNNNFSFTSAAYAFTYTRVDTAGNDLFAGGEPVVIAGTAVDVNRIEIFISYNDYYLDVNYSNADSFFRIYSNQMAKNKYWSIEDKTPYGFAADNTFNVVNYDSITSDFFLNVRKDSKIKNDIQELTDETMFIYPFSLDASNNTMRNFILDIFPNIAPKNNNDYFNTDTIVSGYVFADGVYTEREAAYVGLNKDNNRQIWKLTLPINLDINSIEKLEFRAREGDVSIIGNTSTAIIPLSEQNIIIENSFTWGSLLELTGIFGVTVDLILQILEYDILGIEIGFLIFAPLLFSISIGIIKRIRG